ncbi:MAG TPA: SpoIIE family protein phosphatase [Thermoanaerobaculia bacterium]|nr:SpoIIE family protein phosphatase [Thermoanaerobaculia bacterium]HQN06094.1 SpoIIE family protein phosphatase [Thermoanaerobaculia bacterium]HQP87050.1 SpoIIE family protein phosphatase [Thermoanaerobaculia bacterium]
MTPAPPAARRRAIVVVGILGALIAAMSVADMFLPKAWDGVVPDTYAESGLQVRAVVRGGPAEGAGIRPGDTILGIGRRMLNTPAEAASELGRLAAGETVPYLVKRGEQVLEREVLLSPYRLGSASYVYYALLGGLFFGLGLFVYSRRARDEAAEVFFLLCVLFMLFFVCRLRPSSYYWIDWFVQVAGTLALFLLGAVFLHFFLLFPRRKVFRFAEARPGEDPPAAPLVYLQRFLNGSPALFVLLYTLPPAFYALQMAVLRRTGDRSVLVYGAPRANWILLADYLVLGLLALAHSWWTAREKTTRRPILVLLLGTLGGIVPFVLFAVYFPSLFRDERYLAWGVVPMALVPLTFAYAIVRFRLFDVQVIVGKSIVYAILTAIVTGLYALAVVAGNALVSSRTLSPLFAFAFGLAVVLLVDPLRRRMQAVVDRLFFRDRADFQSAFRDISRQVVAQLDRGKMQQLLTERTAELLRLSRLDLLTPRPEDGALADPRRGDVSLPVGAALGRLLVERDAPVPLRDLDPWALDAPSRSFLKAQLERGARVLVPVATRGRLLGVLAAGEKKSEEEFHKEDLDNLVTIANQGALGLEVAALHEQLTRRAEVERDLEIARDIQVSLFPRELPRIAGIELYGVSLPAKVVGGDFYDFLPVDGGFDGRVALVVGDVSGKSIPASLLMVAAKEIVYARAMQDPEPSTVFRESNRRIYEIKRRMFVSLGYFLYDPVQLTLHYSIGGQPLPLVVRGGEAVELPAPVSRLPLGALRETTYDAKTFWLRRGDLLLFYTDGLNEAMSVESAYFGDERLKASLVRHSAAPLPEMAEEILEDIRQFTFGAEQSDDATFVLLRVTGAKPAPPGSV